MTGGRIVQVIVIDTAFILFALGHIRAILTLLLNAGSAVRPGPSRP
jgi:hypothetical protein